MLLGDCISRHREIINQAVAENPSDKICQRTTISPLKDVGFLKRTDL